MGNDPGSLDDMVAGFLDASFWAGEHSSLGPRLTSALGSALPQYSKWWSAQIPRTRQASAAAGRRAGNTVRLPLPEAILAAVVTTMVFVCHSNNVALDPALAIWLAAHCYLRPGEFVRLQWQYVVFGVGSDAGRASLVLHTTEQSRASKTGEFDETVVIDDKALVAAIVR